MAEQPAHIVVLEFGATGHFNPALALMKELATRGCKVTCFIDEHLQEVTQAAGADWMPYRYAGNSSTGFLGMKLPLDIDGIAKYVPAGTPEEEYSDKVTGVVYWTESAIPALIEDMLRLDPPPSAIVYDQFVMAAPVVAHVLGIPAICMVTVPGPGVIARPAGVREHMESLPWVAGPRRAISARYGFDVLEHGTIMESYSTTLNLVTTIGELYAPPATQFQVQRFGNSPFRCVGPMVDHEMKRAANANISREPQPTSGTCAVADEYTSGELPWEQIDTARASGRQVIFVSLGTVATGPFWRSKFGAQGSRNAVDDVTGREFCEHVWNVCLQVLGGNERYLVIMALGSEPEALECLPEVPDNFILRDTVPQLKVLARCDAFVTHCGANSMHEGLLAGVPLIVIPVFGDQPVNAETVERSGAGVAFLKPLASLSAASLSARLSDVLDGDMSSYRQAASAMAAKLKQAGGTKEAACSILELVAENDVHVRAVVGGA